MFPHPSRLVSGASARNLGRTVSNDLVIVAGFGGLTGAVASLGAQSRTGGQTAYARSRSPSIGHSQPPPKNAGVVAHNSHTSVRDYAAMLKLIPRI